MDEKVIKFEGGSNKNKYKVKDIENSTVYTKKSAIGYLPDFYYLLF